MCVCEDENYRGLIIIIVIIIIINDESTNHFHMFFRHAITLYTSSF